MTRVLVVDDEPLILRALRINLHARQYDVVTAGTCRGAIQAVSHAHPDLVILDLGLPDMDGVAVIRSLRKLTQVPIVSQVHLTTTEWQLLQALVRHLGRLVSQRQLPQEVWGPTYVERAHYLRQYVKALRHKLEDDPTRPRHLITESGMGYRFQP